MTQSILIAEDEADSRRILRDILSKEKFRVFDAASGEEALRKVREEKPDLVLLDTKLPDMDGIEVCRQIKGIKGSTVKVIVYTGYIDAVDVTRARVAGADGYEAKTQDFAQLLSAVKKLI